MSAIMTPWVADASSYALRVKRGSATRNVTVSLTQGRQYWRSADATADSAAGNGDLLTLIEAAIRAEFSASDVDLDWAYQGTRPLVRMQCPVGIQVLWADSATTFPPELLGFDSSDTGDAATIVAPERMPGLWSPQASISEDSRDRYMPRRGVRESLSGLIYASSFGEGAARREVGWTLVQQRWVLSEYEVEPGEALESYWVDWVSKGERFRLYESNARGDIVNGSFQTYRVSDVNDPAERNGTYPYRWDIRLSMRAST